ncbi:MAG: MmcB family DNA repair protein [Pseudomonadota bacterium]
MFAKTQLQPGQVLARGVCRALGELDLTPLTEFPTKAGLRMDVLALARDGEIWCVEVKSSRADFASDRKWQGYLDWCDRFLFAVPEGFPDEILPGDQGLMRADAYGAEVLRPGLHRPLAAARRKAVTLRFARLAAERALRLASG